MFGFSLLVEKALKGYTSIVQNQNITTYFLDLHEIHWLYLQLGSLFNARTQIEEPFHFQMSLWHFHASTYFL